MFSLFTSGFLGTEPFESVDLGRQIGGAEVEVEVHPVLSVLRLRDLLQEQSWRQRGPRADSKSW